MNRIIGTSASPAQVASSLGRLSGRVAVVTGAAQGLGRAYADRLLAAGALVALWDVADGQLRETSAALTEKYGADRVVSAVTDVFDEDSVRSSVDRVVGRWSQVTVLVNNAGGGLFPAGPSEKMTVEQFSRVLAVNVTGAWLCSREVLPHMRAEGYGKIINVTSTMVTSGLPTGLVAYTTAKAGIVGLTRAMARESAAKAFVSTPSHPAMSRCASPAPCRPRCARRSKSR